MLSQQQQNTQNHYPRGGLGGWGSAVSRKSYACLRALGESERAKEELDSSSTTSSNSQKTIPRQSAIIEGEAWGYFVDTPD